MKSRILRVISVILGCAILLNGVILCFTTNFNIGNILTLLLGIIFVVLGTYYQKFKKIMPKWLKLSIVFLLIICFVFPSFLVLYGLSDSPDFKEDALIVLGAAVQGDTPSLALRDRLDRAVEYHKNNPNAIIVVSGGKGPQENISEAEAMENYLISNEVNSEVIIKEEKSTSTYENFLYSKDILDELFGENYKVAFISNEYHIYRAKGIAECVGLSDTVFYHSNTRWYSVLPGTLRECLAVMKFWILGV